MARRYAIPHCIAPLPSGAECGHEMRPLKEVEENHVKKAWVFMCGYCGAVRAVDVDKLGRYFAAV